MVRKNDEAWETYVHARYLELDGSVHYVDADDLKNVTTREPRLLAKVDSLGELPTVFKDQGYAILPITNGRYILFRGSIFYDVLPRPAIEQFTPNLPFHLETAGRGIGEMQYLDHAFNTGMVSAFIGANRGPLYLTIRGRERSGDFDFPIAGQPVHVSGVQVEVDGGYEGLRDILLAEAKIGVPTSFNIRQLFYPYRRFSSLVPTKRVRPLFFAYDFSYAAYSFYEFE